MAPIRTSTVAAALVSLATLLGGCGDEQNNPLHRDGSYRTGGLGNGAFLFVCESGASCGPSTTTMTSSPDFPHMVAAGATFDVRYVPHGEEGGTLRPAGSKYAGVTGEALAPFLRNTERGYVALRPGQGTIVVRDHRSVIIDYFTMSIVTPTSLVAYRADLPPTTNPPAVDRLVMTKDDRRSLRSVAMAGQEPIAGSIAVEWRVDNPEILVVESVTGGIVNVVAKGIGPTRLRGEVEGVAEAIAIDVQVTP
jgi:hypothetical protein